ncbi:MAG TPA: galactose oxidase-like domain-containing protein [Dehalococcoidia bacterium]|nr:galactose oxidase-like domain-containing protein [Dehalococcoidia bacterium]
MTAIDDKYAQLGGAAGFLGAVTIDEHPAADGVGAFAHYLGGSILWHPATGAHEVHGAIKEKYDELGWEAGFLGYPLTDETGAPDGVGRFNHFQGGSIYWHPQFGAHEVHGAIRDKWQEHGWEAGTLGYPATDELPCQDGVGRFNHFQHGSIFWTPATGAHEVHGAIKVRWEVLGYEHGALGYPTSDEHDSEHGFARVSEFQRGAIFWDVNRGPYEVFPPPPPAAPNPPVGGRWDIPDFDSGIVGVHAALFPEDKVLLFTYLNPGEHAEEAPQPLGDSVLLNYTTGAITKPPVNTPQPMNLFCSGHAQLPDGRLLVTGGEREFPGIFSLHIFTPGGPAGGQWQFVGNMNRGRWYPTAVTLHDGRVLIIGGMDLSPNGTRAGVADFEIYTDGAGVNLPTPAPHLAQAGLMTFPFVYVLPSGRLLVHAGELTRFLDLGSMSWVGPAIAAADRPGKNARTYHLEGTSVLLPLKPGGPAPYRARVMVFGGGGPPGADIRTPATETCEIMDCDAAAPAWALAPSMSRPRVMPDAVLLPDGTVLVMNGSSTGVADNGANPVYETEIYDPETSTWRPMANMAVPRLYHATALLLPDGRVMTAGTDSMWNPDPFHHSQLRLEFFSPPYLFAGQRPTFSAAPPDVAYGAAFSVATPDGATVDEAVLMRCGSCTHSFNPDQRYVGLTILSRPSGGLTLQAPPNGFVAPPGRYMLFLLRGGVPSVAKFVMVHS